MPTFRQHLDSRDGKVYNCVLMPDGKWWSAENLAWDGAGVFYDNNPANGPIYGKLYSWTEANANCPPGTHLPSDAEWTALEVAIPALDGTRLKADSALWLTNTGTDDYGFAALPGGRLIPADQFGGISEGCWFWTSTVFGSDTRWQRFLDESASMLRGTDVEGLGCSVRFIVDVFVDPVPPTRIYGTFSGSGVQVFATFSDSGATVEVPLSAQSTTSLTISQNFIDTFGVAGGRARLLIVDGENLSEWKDWDFRI